MYYSMPVNMFFIVKNHWQPYFTDNPRNMYVSVFSFKVRNKAVLHIYLPRIVGASKVCQKHA
jgi:hypothetical protein